MSQFDNLKDKAQQAAQDNPDKVEQASDKGLDAAGGAADKATGGGHSDKVDKAQQAADDRIGDKG